MKSIGIILKSPLVISPLAHEKWLAVTEAVAKRLEVYAFLLVSPAQPFRIVDIDLPRQTVTGGSCVVTGKDVMAAGERAAKLGLVVAGSIHRHPWGNASHLSCVDERLLSEMADELASEVTVKARFRGGAVPVGRVYCLVWSPGGGYDGAAATVIYDPAGGPIYDFRDLTAVLLEETCEKVRFDRRKLRALASRAVRKEPERTWQRPAEVMK